MGKLFTGVPLLSFYSRGQSGNRLKVQIITYRLKSVQSEREEFPSLDAQFFAYHYIRPADCSCKGLVTEFLL